MLKFNSIFCLSRWKWRMALGAGALMLIGVPANTIAQETQKSGNIDSFTCQPQHFKLNGETGTVEIFKTLYVNDEIIVERPEYDDESCSLTVSFNGNREAEILTYKKTYRNPYIVPKISVTKNTLIDTLMASASQWIRSWIVSEPEPYVKAMTKSTKPYIPLLMTETGKNAKLVAGQEGIKKLHLAWKGGQGDYTVKVQKQMKGGSFSTFLTIPSDKTATMITFSQPLKKETEKDIYRLIVTDSSKGSGQQNFQVVASLPSELQAKKQEIEKLRLSSNEEPVILATVLASEGDSEWNFEAYQYVAKDELKNYQAAQEVKKALEKGVNPKSKQ